VFERGNSRKNFNLGAAKPVKYQLQWYEKYKKKY
jgi:hypothetical protein